MKSGLVLNLSNPELRVAPNGELQGPGKAGPERLKRSTEMKKLVTVAAALAVAASGLVACNDKKEDMDMMPSSEMMAPSEEMTK